MSDYQVIARKFRPQTFKEVIGQDAIVTTLKNAIKFHRLAQAYLFCGSRGTGKTTLARLLAKTINCQQLTTDYEPCNQCSSCREIASGTSLDVLEIDGASHRGIEDIRQINETVGYAASSGRYKIYLIDEVHMLTKEAFNALLKTLEEPPSKVKFFFATTEPHKVPSTILSRCQRFNLGRIPSSHIVNKLRDIAYQLGVEVEEEALHLLAQRAEGGLRDAESLFDQVLAFEEGPVTAASVTAILGLMPREIYFEIDRAGKNGEFAKAFEIAHSVFSEGKEILFFIEGLIDHLRQILFIKVSGLQTPLINLTEKEKEKYVHAASLYTQEQCLDLIEYLLEAHHQLRLTAFGKVSLEAILLHVMRSHFRLSIEQLVHHLSELEQRVNEKNESSPSQATPSLTTPLKPTSAMIPNRPINTVQTSSPAPFLTEAKSKSDHVITPSKPASPPPNLFDSFVSEDPTPSPADLGKSAKTMKNCSSIQPFSKGSSTPVSQPLPSVDELKRPQHVYDTIMHFAAVELEGRLQKN